MENGNVQMTAEFSRDAAIKRLRALRDYLKKRGYIAKAGGVESAIQALKGMQ